MKRAILCFVILLSACATHPPVALGDDTATAQKGLAAVTSADLDSAIAIANANGDTVGASCWAAVKAWLVPSNPVQAPAPSGVFSGFEALRGKVNALQAGVPSAVHVACAPVILDAQGVAIKLGLIAAGLK